MAVDVVQEAAGVTNADEPSMDENETAAATKRAAENFMVIVTN